LSGSASAPSTLVFTFYHQFLETLSYSVSGGGVGYSPPVFTANQFGVSVSQVLTTTPAAGWFDANSVWVVTNPLSGSTTSEGWYTSQAASGTISGAATRAFTYTHQFSETLSYVVVGGGSPTVPGFTANRFGKSVKQTLTSLPTGYWFDAGSAWSVTNPLSGSSSIQQWFTSQPTSGTVSSAQAIVFSYQHQYYLTMKVSSSTAGSVAPMNGWYDAGAQVSITATANTGHTFKSWTGTGSGSYTGSNNPAAITMNSAITETGNFT
jgi:hypothetical protein